MSRAFVKESDGEELLRGAPKRKHSGLPNYITPGGAEALRERLADLSKQRAELAKQSEQMGAKSAVAR